MTYLRYVLEFLLVYPAAFLTLRPARFYSKYPRVIVYTAAAIVLTVLVLCGSWICTETGIASNAVIFPSMIPLFILFYVSYDLSIGKKIFCFFNGSMLCAFSTMYTIYITAPLEKDNQSSLFLPESSLVALGLSLLNGVIFYRTMKEKIPYLLDNPHLENIWLPLSSIPFAVTFLFVYSAPINPAAVMTGRLRPLAMLFFAIVLIIILLLYHIMWWCARQITLKTDLEETNNTLQMEEKRYEELRAYIDHTRTLRHDFRQHVILLKHYLDIGDLDQLAKSLDEFDSVLTGTRTAYCKNHAIDAMVAHYVRVAKKQGIQFECSFLLPEQISIPLNDFCVVLGNLLENAIHAVAELPPENRTVSVQAKMLTEEMIGVSVSNPYTGSVRFDRRGIPKTERKHHGIGLRSVTDTVKRYQGNIQFIAERQVFTVNLSMYGKTAENADDASDEAS